MISRRITKRTAYAHLGTAFAMLAILFFGASCASRAPRYEKKIEELKKNEEFEKQVQILIPEVQKEAPGLSPTPGAQPLAPTKEGPRIETPEATGPAEKPSTKKQKALKSVKKLKPGAKEPGKSQLLDSSKTEAKSEPEISAGKVSSALPHLPSLENGDSFSIRRPLVDPFRVGERVSHSVRYMKFNAGTLSFFVDPFAVVNGRKSYNFRMAIRTSSIFSTFYSVEDDVTTLVDFEDLVPSVFKLTVKETGQLRESQAFFDSVKKTATFWEKKFTEAEGETQKKLLWEIEEYAQNVYSAAFYLRTFKWEVGKTNAFRVANDGENLVFSAKALRRETIETDAGTFTSLVLQPEIHLKGQYKPVGEVFMWLSDDDRKYILRIETKIKIGTLVSQITELVPGTP